MSSTSASALQAMAERHRLCNGYLKDMPEDTPRLESEVAIPGSHSYVVVRHTQPQFYSTSRKPVAEDQRRESTSVRYKGHRLLTVMSKRRVTVTKSLFAYRG